MPQQKPDEGARARAEAEADLAQARGSAEADLAQARSTPQPVASHKVTPPSVGGIARDVGVGAAKGTGTWLLDLGRIISGNSPANPMSLLPDPIRMAVQPGYIPPAVAKSVGDRLRGGGGTQPGSNEWSPALYEMAARPGYVPPELDKPMRQALTPANHPERVGSWLPDIVSTAVPAIRGARVGAPAIRDRAAQTWQNAAHRDPLESTRLAQEVLDSGFYKLTGDNARKFAGAFPNSTEARTALYEGVKLARDQPQTIGKWMTGMIAPGVKANFAGKVNTAAPVIAGVKGATQGAVADILARFLAGQR